MPTCTAKKETVEFYEVECGTEMEKVGQWMTKTSDEKMKFPTLYQCPSCMKIVLE